MFQPQPCSMCRRPCVTEHQAQHHLGMLRRSGIVVAPFRSTRRNAHKDTPLLSSVHPVVDDLGVLQVSCPVKHLLRV